MLKIDTLKIIRCTKLRPAHPLNCQAANRAYKEAFRRTTEALRVEVESNRQKENKL